MSNPKNLTFAFGGHYVVTDSEKFAKMTTEDASNLGKLEYNVMRRKWKQSGRRLRAIGDFERLLKEFGLRVAVNADTQEELPPITWAEKRAAISAKEASRASN